MSKYTPTSSFNDEAYAAASGVARLVIKKQHDYGKNNILKCPLGPEQGLIVRLSDKIHRLTHLIESGATPENESLSDTADDIMGYGLVLKMVLEGTFELPLEERGDES